jgi:peptidyl-prolyl cis-trans isomerase A (cyclophilin A)
MRNAFLVSALLSISALAVWAQSSPQAAPAAKPATTPKPPVHHVAAGITTAIIETTAGNMTCTLFPDKAPIGVENFIGLATGTKDWKNPASGVTKHGVPLYDGTIFHRVIPDFMIQGGDPKGDGTGDPGYQFKNEVSSDLLFDKPGRLAYANSGPDTNGSQFFITEDVAHSAHLSGSYTIFGQCDDATVALVKQIARMATDPRNNRPFRPVKIVHIKIVHGAAAATAAKPATPAKPATTVPKPATTPN